MQIGTAPIDLAFVFFSAHHAASLMISAMLQRELRAKVCLELFRGRCHRRLED
jgi:hypothetical protein